MCAALSDASLRPNLPHTARCHPAPLYIAWFSSRVATGDGAPKYAAQISRSSIGPARRCRVGIDVTHQTALCAVLVDDAAPRDAAVEADLVRARQRSDRRAEVVEALLLDGARQLALRAARALRTVDYGVQCTVEQRARVVGGLTIS